MYIKQAFKGNIEWWRYLITFLIVVFAQFIGSLPLGIITFINAASNPDIAQFKETFDPAFIGLSQNVGLLFMMLPMMLTFFGLVLAMRYVHGYSIREIFTSANRFRWKNFFFAFLIWGLFLVIAELIYYQIHPEHYIFNFNPATFFPLLLISLIMIPLQAGAEELYFRGNLLQGISILTNSRITGLLVTSVCFGLLHFSNPEVKQFGIATSMTYYIGFGLLMGVLVLLDGGLEMPLAMHAINNIYGAVFVGYSGSVLQTPTLFKLTQYNTRAMLIMFVMASAIYLLVAKKQFYWQSLKDILKPVRDVSN